MATLCFQSGVWSIKVNLFHAKSLLKTSAALHVMLEFSESARLQPVAVFVAFEVSLSVQELFRLRIISGEKTSSPSSPKAVSPSSFFSET
jgi:hypothetical protein